MSSAIGAGSGTNQTREQKMGNALEPTLASSSTNGPKRYMDLTSHTTPL